MSNKNTQRNRTDFSELQTVENRNPETNVVIKRNCDFQSITTQHLIVAKVRSLKEEDLKERRNKKKQIGSEETCISVADPNISL